MCKFIVNPYSSLPAYETKQHVSRVGRTSREMIYIPTLPFLPSDIIIIDNFHHASQTDTCAAFVIA